MPKTPQTLDRFDTCLLQWMEVDRLAAAAEQLIEDALDSFCAGAGPAPHPRDVEFARCLRRAAASGFGRVVACTQGVRAGVPEI